MIRRLKYCFKYYVGETYKNLAIDNGISLELMHRVASMASGALDSLPHNGAVITIITLCGLTA